MKDPAAPAVKREAEEDWARERWKNRSHFRHRIDRAGVEDFELAVRAHSAAGGSPRGTRRGWRPEQLSRRIEVADLT
jgi:hypothetical protein